MSRSAMTALLALCFLPALAQAAPPRLVAKRVMNSPRIDGVLSDPAWEKAFAAAPFVLLGSGEPASQATRAWVLSDASHLYVGFECMEERPSEMLTTVTQRDGQTWLDDSVELFIAPRPEPKPYYHFIVNSDGVLRDEQGQDETWDSGAVAAAATTPGGWSVELMVPFADLRITAASAGDWRLNLCRDERPFGETTSWAPTQQGFHEPGRFGWLTDLNVNVVRFAREGLLEQVDRALAELRPSLDKARGAKQLTAAKVALEAGEAAEGSLTQGRAAAAPARASVEDIEAAEGHLAQGLASLAAFRAALPRMNMSIALRNQGAPTEYAVCEESSMARVRPGEPYSRAPATGLGVSLAANEYEATQLVVVPIEQRLGAVRVSVSGLRGPSGSEIPAAELTVNLVGHVNVTQPSARSGAAPGLYPDPLLANAPADIALHDTASWLVTVHAPPGQPAGTYTGQVTVAPANAPERTLPLRATVWGFELPRTSSLRNCFRLIPSYLWKLAQLPSAPGVPVGWEFGVWSGADVEGREGYYGTGDFNSRFETNAPRSGNRAIAIDGTVATPGVEVPRACYHRVLPVRPNTDYVLSVWYRTEGLADGKAQLHIHTHQVHVPLKAVDEWTESRLVFNSGDRDDCRVYLCNYGVGTVLYDDVSLSPVAAPDANVVDDPSFETGASFEKRAELLRAYRLNMLQHRCSDMNVASPDVRVDAEGTVTIDWTEFDREIEFYIDHGLNAFNVHWARVPGGWGKVTGADPEQLRVSAEILRQTEEHLGDRGWLDMAYLYTIDEPGKDAFPDVKAAFDHVRRAAPGIKRLLTFGYGASRPVREGNPVYRRLEGFVDIWVPHSDCYEPEYLENRRRAGDEIWEYVCISAQKPYANMWGIDFPGTDPRVVFWQCYAEEITGFLYWAVNYWTGDPWQDPLTYPGGNGDGSLVYPGEDGPVNSLRWETVRDGIEDYDTLALLEALVRRAEGEGGRRDLCKRAAEALDVGPVTESFTEYTESPETILARRAQVAELIERFLDRLAAE